MVRWIIYVLCVLRFAEAEPLFVSLGSHCEVAIQLRDHGFRTHAYPFDWLISLNHERLIALLDEDFRFFLDGNCFACAPTPGVVENICYEMEFRHDWPFSDHQTNPSRTEKQLQCIQQKYARRVDRFREIRKHVGPVFFIRVAYDFQNGGDNYWWSEKYAHI
ncbi:MAG: DUF1796 family putative cysteine peptidase [Chlamydiales bacterium]